jgi:hypothetical protein
LELKFDRPLSNFAFNLHLRRYSKEVAMKTQTEWVSKLKFLHGTSEQFLAEMVMVGR